MSAILAIETSTEACSVARVVDEKIMQRHEVIPRRHNQRLFQMLGDLVPSDTDDQALTHIAFGCGPGSFTGLRIAASAAQGLAFARGVPIVAVSSLAVLAQTALTQGMAGDGERVLATIDARVDELYGALYHFEEGLAQLVEGPFVCAPEQLSVVTDSDCVVVGTGCRYARRFPGPWCDLAEDDDRAQLLPHAAAMLPLARAAIAAGQILSPSQAVPDYVREEISWKKLPEQGKRT